MRLLKKYNSTLDLRSSRHSILLLMLLFQYTYSVKAQEQILTGKVLDNKTNEPIAYAMVTVRTIGEDRIIKYAQSAMDGTYSLPFVMSDENYIICFSMMGYASQRVPFNKNQSVYNMKLKEQSTMLKEVIVKAPGIRQSGDTISYLVSKFADEQDHALADVLRKMPGIEVEKSGAIKYNGVAINRFYVEGRDMLGRRYGLATNNIQQKDVANVEVMENHQPIKALENLSFSQSPAINIKLKENAKSRWAGNAKLETGAPSFLRNAELSLMRFASKQQSLNTFKTNNIGLDVLRENDILLRKDFLYFLASDYELTDYVKINPGYLTDLDENRTRFNNSYSINTNNLWAIGRHYDLTSNISYINYRLTSDNHSNITYYLPDSTILVDGEEHTLARRNLVAVDLQLTLNTMSYYLKNKFSAELNWNDLEMQTLGTYPNEQITRTPFYKLSNELELVKRSKRRAFALSSYNTFLSKPQDLSVSQTTNNSFQDISSSAFFTHTNSSYTIGLKQFRLSTRVGVQGLIRHLYSNLIGIPDSLGDLKNDRNVGFLRLYMEPALEFNNNKWELKFEMPWSVSYYCNKDRLVNKKESFAKYPLSSRIHVEYKFTPQITAILTAGIFPNKIDEQLFYSGLLLRDYRNLTRGEMIYDAGEKKTFTFSFSYRNVFSSFFGNISATHIWDTSQYMPDRTFINEYVLKSYIQQHNSSRNWVIIGNLSKGVAAINGLVSMKISMAMTDASMFQNSVVTNYCNTSWTVVPQITSRVTRWFNLTFEANLAKNSLNVDKGKVRVVNKAFTQALYCNFIPVKSLILRLKSEYYYNKQDVKNSKSLFLIDSEVIYSFKRGWEVNLSAKNIFNHDSYSYSLYDGLTNIYKKYNIRPLNIMVGVFFRF